MGRAAGDVDDVPGADVHTLQLEVPDQRGPVTASLDGVVVDVAAVGRHAGPVGRRIVDEEDTLTAGAVMHPDPEPGFPVVTTALPWLASHDDVVAVRRPRRRDRP